VITPQEPLNELSGLTIEDCFVAYDEAKKLTSPATFRSNMPSSRVVLKICLERRRSHFQAECARPNLPKRSFQPKTATKASLTDWLGDDTGVSLSNALIGLARG
jgi:hypothetical protein